MYAENGMEVALRLFFLTAKTQGFRKGRKETSRCALDYCCNPAMQMTARSSQRWAL